MPAKKKQPVQRTGIYYLAAEYRTLHPAYARMSNHDLILLVLPQWRSMTLGQKKPYDDLAKQFKRARMLNVENVITPVIPSSEEVSFIETNHNENKFLDTYFAHDLIDIFKRDLLFLNFQIFCRTDDEDGGDYYPAEIGIMKYSFFESVKEEYFTIIKPEKFPVGYTGTAIDLSRETHQIPPFEFIGANGDYGRIWEEVKRIIGDFPREGPIIVFCNAFERDQTTYLLKWLISKDNSNSSFQPTFRVCSFEALVAALLRRLGYGDFAHQSVREQLRRPVYTLQVKERCAYHDSLAIQYCCRAINYGFSLFLDAFIRQRFIQILPDHVQKLATNKTSTRTTWPTIELARLLPDTTTVETSSSPSSIVADSICSTYITKQKILRAMAYERQTEEEQQLSLQSLELDDRELPTLRSGIAVQSLLSNLHSPVSTEQMNVKTSNHLSPMIKTLVATTPPASPIDGEFRWSKPTSNSDDEEQYIITGRGIRKTIKRPSTATSNSSSNNSEPLVFVNSIGRGRRYEPHPPPPPGFHF